MGSVLRNQQRLVVRALGAAVALGYAAMGLTTVAPDEVGIVQRCGRFTRLLDPGIHWRLPPPWESVAKFTPDRIRVAEIGFRSKPEASRAEGRAVEWTSTHREGLIDTGLKRKPWYLRATKTCSNSTQPCTTEFVARRKTWSNSCSTYRTLTKW
jgi:hypothetical protein